MKPITDLNNLEEWFRLETIQIGSEPVRNVLHQVARHLDEFVKWPAQAVLLWEGCDRRRRYHQYPESLRELSRKLRIDLDGRSNGPAIAAFRIAGGIRPKRLEGSNSWSIHHIYSGKFRYPDQANTTHAVRECRHFTQSAGLIATHPITDAMCDEFPFFAWLVRAESYKQFGYDPDGVFSSNRDEFGFAPGHGYEILVRAA
jgi:hypothetical protein